jgi:hypothetical protein
MENLAWAKREIWREVDWLPSEQDKADPSSKEK